MDLFTFLPYFDTHSLIPAVLGLATTKVDRLQNRSPIYLQFIPPIRHLQVYTASHNNQPNNRLLLRI